MLSLPDTRFKINGVYKSPKWSNPPGVLLIVLEHKTATGLGGDLAEVWLCQNAVTDEKVACTARFLRACDLVGERKNFTK